MKRTLELQDFVDEMSKECFGLSTSEAIEKGICVQCRQLALKNCYSEAGRREFKISGLCEKCFDTIFSE